MFVSNYFVSLLCSFKFIYYVCRQLGLQDDLVVGKPIKCRVVDVYANTGKIRLSLQVLYNNLRLCKNLRNYFIPFSMLSL